MGTDERCSEAFMALVDWTTAQGCKPMNQYEGLYEADIDDKWHVRINGHRETIDSVPAFHAAVDYNGWPALLMTPYGGTSLLGRDGWRAEDAFIEALKARV